MRTPTATLTLPVILALSAGAVCPALAQDRQPDAEAKGHDKGEERGDQHLEMRVIVHYDVLILAEQIVWIGHVGRSQIVCGAGGPTVPAIEAGGGTDITIELKPGGRAPHLRRRSCGARRQGRR